MSEIVEFILRGTDQLSKPLANTAKESDKAARSLSNLSKEERVLNKIMAATGDSAAALDNKIKKLKDWREILPSGATQSLRQVNAEIERFEGKVNRLRSMGTKGGGGGASNILTGALGSLPGMGSMSFLPPQLMAGLAAAGALAASVNSGMQAQYKRTQYSNEYGVRGSALYDDLRGARGSLGEGAISAGQSLADGGMSLRQVKPTLLRLGDVANGKEGRLGALADTMAAITKEGRLTSSSMQGLEANGFNPLLEISERTGKSFSTLLTELEDGKIGADQVATALRDATSEGGRFFGNTERLAGTSLSKMKSLKETTANLFSNFSQNFTMSMVTPIEKAVTSSDSFITKIKSMVALGQVMNEANLGGGLLNFMGLFADPSKAPSLGAKSGPKEPFSSSMLDWQKKGKFQEDGSFESNESLLKKAQAAKDDEAKRQEAVNAVSGGGGRNVTINIEKMVEKIENVFQGGGTQDYADSLRQVVEEVMVRTIASAAGR
jgi:hypothetical protein